LRFTVDPAWILGEKPPLAGPVVLEFLREYREALAEELRERQVMPEPRIAPPPAIDVEAVPKIPVASEGRRKGLPSWFEASCSAKR
jgi:hypothetical protein